MSSTATEEPRKQTSSRLSTLTLLTRLECADDSQQDSITKRSTGAQTVDSNKAKSMHEIQPGNTITLQAASSAAPGPPSGLCTAVHPLLLLGRTLPLKCSINIGMQACNAENRGSNPLKSLLLATHPTEPTGQSLIESVACSHNHGQNAELATRTSQHGWLELF